MHVIMMAKDYSDLWFPNPSGLQPLVIEDFSETFLKGCSAYRNQEQEGFNQFARSSFPAHLVWRLTVASQGLPVILRSSK